MISFSHTEIFHSQQLIFISRHIATSVFFLINVFSFSIGNLKSCMTFSYSDLYFSYSDFPISPINHWNSIGNFELNSLLSCLACCSILACHGREKKQTKTGDTMSLPYSNTSSKIFFRYTKIAIINKTSTYCQKIVDRTFSSRLHNFQMHLSSQKFDTIFWIQIPTTFYRYEEIAFETVKKFGNFPRNLRYLLPCVFFLCRSAGLTCVCLREYMSICRLRSTMYIILLRNIF